jgi:hypothetical protein
VIPFLPTPYLAAAAFAGGLLAGGYGVHTWYKAQRVEALQEARTLERDGVRLANQSDVRYIDRIHEQREAAHARAERFETAFQLAADGLRACRVGPDLLGLLNDTGAKPASGPAAEPRPAAPAAQAGAVGSDCAAVVETYRWNIDNVVIPNQLQIESLQEFYRDIQRQFNKR